MILFHNIIMYKDFDILGPGRPYGLAGLDGIVARIQFGWVHFGFVSATRFVPLALSSA